MCGVAGGAKNGGVMGWERKEERGGEGEERGEGRRGLGDEGCVSVFV